MSEEGKVKKSKKIILFAIIGIIIVSGTAFVLSKTVFNKKREPYQIVLDSIVVTAHVDSVKRTITLGIESLELPKDYDDQETALMLDMVEQLNLEFVIQKNKEETQIDFGLNMRSISLINGTIYSNDEIIGIDIPILYDKPLYMTWEDFASKQGLDATKMKEEMKEREKALLSKEYDSVEGLKEDIAIIEAFIQEALLDTVEQEKLELDGKKRELSKYTLQTNLDSLLTLKEDLSSNNESGFNAIIGDSNGTIQAIISKLGLDSLLENFDLNMNTILWIDEDIIYKSETIINTTINGLVDVPVDGVLELEIYDEMVNQAVKPEGLDMDLAINVSELSADEKAALKEDVKTVFLDNVRNNYLLAAFEEFIDFELLFE